MFQAHHSSSPLSTYTSYSFTAPLTLFLPTDGSGSSSLSDEQCECYHRFFLKLFFSSLVHIFPDMPQLFATHRASGNPTFGDKRPENEPGHVLTELNQSLSSCSFFSPSRFSWGKHPNKRQTSHKPLSPLKNLKDFMTSSEKSRKSGGREKRSYWTKAQMEWVSGTPGGPVLICSSLA